MVGKVCTDMVISLSSNLPGVQWKKTFGKNNNDGRNTLVSVKKMAYKEWEKSDEFVHKWFHIVRNMTWKDVKVFFPRRWIAKRGVINEQLDVKEQLQPWKEVVASPDTQVSLNKFMFDSPSGAKRAG